MKALRWQMAAVMTVCALARCTTQQATMSKSAPGAFPKTLPQTYLEIPVSVSLALIARQIEESVPREIKQMDRFEMDSSGRYGVKYLVGREPVRLRGERGLLRTTSTIHYALQGCRRTRKGIGANDFMMFPCVSCGMNEPMRSVRLELASQLAWQGWSIRTITRHLPPSYQTQCEVTLFDIDITRRLIAPRLEAQLREIGKVIDSTTPKTTNFKQEAETVWRFLQSPMKLEEGAWLLFDPAGLATGPIRVEGDRIVTSIGFTARPRVVAGPRPAVPQDSLPAPARAPTAAASELRVPFEVELPFTEVARLISQQFAARQPVRVGNRQVRIFAVSVEAAESGRISIELDSEFRHLLDTFRGSVRLTGIPRYDPAREVLFVSDLDYDLSPSGKQWRIRVGDRLIHEEVRKQIAAAAQWPLRPRLDSVKSQLQKTLNQPISRGIQLQGSVHTLSVEQVFAVPTALRAYGVVSGTARIIIDSM